MSKKRVYNQENLEFSKTEFQKYQFYKILVRNTEIWDFRIFLKLIRDFQNSKDFDIPHFGIFLNPLWVSQPPQKTHPTKEVPSSFGVPYGI